MAAEAAMNIRKQAQWFGHTRRCDTLDQAMDFVGRDLDHISHVSIWPLQRGWMVVTFTSVLVN
jgi:hypothetical protein